MTFASQNLLLWEQNMADEEKEGVQLKTNTSFSWHQIRWFLVLAFCFISSGAQVKSWITAMSIQQTATSAEVSATTATSKTSEIDAIKKELATVRAEVKQYKLALDSWSDFFADEQSRQSSASARERFRQQRVKIREIMKPVSQGEKLHANPLLPTMAGTVPPQPKENE